MTATQAALDKPTIGRLQAVIQDLVTQYQADPDSARAEFRAKSRTIHGFKTEATAREFNLTIDEPEQLGGTNAGPNPVEVLLGSLGTCQQIVIAAYAAALGIELEAIEIDVRGDLDLKGLFNVSDVPAGFRSITFDANIQARNATPEQLEQLKALALDHCPVLDTLQRAIPVQNRYTLGTGTVTAEAAAGA